MPARLASPALIMLALATSSCGLLDPPPTGNITGRVTVCIAGTPVCVNADSDISIEAVGPITETVTLTSEIFRFNGLEVGQYTLTARFTGNDSCVISFDPVQAAVVEDQTVNTTIHGRGLC